MKSDFDKDKIKIFESHTHVVRYLTINLLISKTLFSKKTLCTCGLVLIQPLFLQLVGPMSSAVPLVGSVCLRPGAVMEKQTVWMAVMSSSVLLPVALARYLA